MASKDVREYFEKPTTEQSSKRNLSEGSSNMENSPKRLVYDGEDGAVNLPEDAPVWVAGLLRAIDGIKDDVNARLENLTAKFDAYITDTNTKISAINTAVDTMKSEYDSKIAELTESVSFISAKYDEQLKTNSELAEKLDQLGRLQSASEQYRSQETFAMGGRIDAQEQYSRRNCLLFHGVAETDGENTDERILSTIKEHLGITLSERDLDRSHRLGAPRSDKRARPIIAKFNLYNVRASVYASKKKMKGSNVLVTESLTRRRVAVLTAARNKFGSRNVWTFDGEIFTKQDGKTVNVRTILPSFM